MSLANIKATSDLAPREPFLFDPVGKFHRSQPTRHTCLTMLSLGEGRPHGGLIALTQTGGEEHGEAEEREVCCSCD